MRHYFVEAVELPQAPLLERLDAMPFGQGAGDSSPKENVLLPYHMPAPTICRVSSFYGYSTNSQAPARHNHTVVIKWHISFGRC